MAGEGKKPEDTQRGRERTVSPPVPHAGAVPGAQRSPGGDRTALGAGRRQRQCRLERAGPPPCGGGRGAASRALRRRPSAGSAVCRDTGRRGRAGVV